MRRNSESEETKKSKNADISNMKVAALRILAEQRGIADADGVKNMKKRELQERLSGDGGLLPAYAAQERN